MFVGQESGRSIARVSKSLQSSQDLIGDGSTCKLTHMVAARPPERPQDIVAGFTQAKLDKGKQEDGREVETTVFL